MSKHKRLTDSQQGSARPLVDPAWSDQFGGSPAESARRRLLKLMLQLPLVAAAGWSTYAAARPEFALPESAGEALDIFQIKAAARSRLDLPAWHFIVNGADDGKTMNANRAAYDEWQIRVRRMVDVSRIDTRVEVLGTTLENPVILAPVGGQTTIHVDGELATARGAARRKNLMVCSTVSSYSISEIAEVAAGPLWFQLYPSPDQDLMRHLLARAEAAGCDVVVVTVDSPTRGNREGERWFADQMDRSRMRMGNLEDYAGPPRIGDPAVTWGIIRWLRDNTRMRIVLKGIVTAEDAALCVEHGVDGIIVSNHGGRQEESGRGTLHCLPEVVDAAGASMPVLIDGGIRRGTDIFKALALGARAVCVGRPYLWGLGAFGDAGVEKALAILRTELRTIMQFAGTTSITAIDRRYLVKSGQVPVDAA